MEAPSAIELARQIATCARSARDVVETHIRRIEDVNPSLNAVVTSRFDLARDEADEADRLQASGATLPPLHGVPVTVKDAIDVADLPSTFGLPRRAREVAERDDVHVARLRQAGAIVLGKTNVAQLLLGFESDNPLYGRTNHPLDGARSPGGSSGGEAAIIAAGGSPLGIGTDIAGSVRMPAAFCGLASIKPTTGRLPDRGRFSVPPGQQAIQSQVGVLARTVADVALGLEVLNGGREPDPRSRMPLGDWTAVEVSRLTVGWFDDDGLLTPSPAIRRAVRESADHLATLGATVVPWRPPDPDRAAAIFLRLLSADGARGLKEALGADPVSPGLAPFYRLMRLPRGILGTLQYLQPWLGPNKLAAATLLNIGYRDTHSYWRATEARDGYAAQTMEALDTSAATAIDVVICPPAALPAYRHDQSGAFGFAGSYSLLWNLLGYPAGTVPAGRIGPLEETDRPESRDPMERAAVRCEEGSAGLPVGVQVVARPWRDHEAIAVMAALERWRRRESSRP